jgi:hypothetical protein
MWGVLDETCVVACWMVALGQAQGVRVPHSLLDGSLLKALHHIQQLATNPS